MISSEGDHAYYDARIRDDALREYVDANGLGLVLYLTRFIDKRFVEVENGLRNEIAATTPAAACSSAASAAACRSDATSGARASRADVGRLSLQPRVPAGTVSAAENLDGFPTGPSKTFLPFAMTMPRSQSSRTMFMSWLTTSIVIPRRSSSLIFAAHFARNGASPTDSTSSTSRTSTSTWIATENASRMNMPEE